MKKTVLLLSMIAASFTACKKDTKTTEATHETAPKETTYRINPEATTINWTAYKTTDKTPVKGIFKTIKIKNNIPTTAKQDALKGLTFEIPVSSFFSKNEIRDTKIKNLFFGIMDETISLSGNFTSITGDDKKGNLTLHLKMNGNTVPVPMTYTITNNTITIDGTISNLMDWKMDKAFTSLHQACELLHTGADGVSKTWTDVAISATTVLLTK